MQKKMSTIDFETRLKRKKMKSIPDFEKLERDRLEVGPNFCEKYEVIINVFGSPQPGQARKNLGIKRNKKLFTNLQTVINQDQKSLTLEVFSSYFQVFPGAWVKRSAVQKYSLCSSWPC